MRFLLSVTLLVVVTLSSSSSSPRLACSASLPNPPSRTTTQVTRGSCHEITKPSERTRLSNLTLSPALQGAYINPTLASLHLALERCFGCHCHPHHARCTPLQSADAAVDWKEPHTNKRESSQSCAILLPTAFQLELLEVSDLIMSIKRRKVAVVSAVRNFLLLQRTCVGVHMRRSRALT